MFIWHYGLWSTSVLTSPSPNTEWCYSLRLSITCSTSWGCGKCLKSNCAFLSGRLNHFLISRVHYFDLFYLRRWVTVPLSDEVYANIPNDPRDILIWVSRYRLLYTVFIFVEQPWMYLSVYYWSPKAWWERRHWDQNRIYFCQCRLPEHFQLVDIFYFSSTEWVVAGWQYWMYQTFNGLC